MHPLHHCVCVCVCVCVSVDGLLAPEARCFVQRLSDHLSLRWKQPFSVASSWVRAHLLFATVI